MDLKKLVAKPLGVAGIALMAALPLQSQAGLMVDTITITGAVGFTYPVSYRLQVSEVIAWGTGTDFATTLAGATAGSTSALGSSCFNAADPDECSIDGVGPSAYFNSPGVYHGTSGTPGTDALTVTLLAASELDYVEILGRTDTCCTARDVYDVTLSLEGQRVLTISSLEAGSRYELPLPGTMALLGMGLLGLGFRLRKTA